MSEITNIYDAIAEVVRLMNVEGANLKYRYAYNKEIEQILAELSRDPATKEDKYPLLYLPLWLEDNVGSSDKNYLAETTVNLFLITQGETYSKSKERKAKYFEPTLWPLYDLFLHKLVYSNLFDRDEKFRIPHTRVDRFYDSQTEQKRSNKVPDFWETVGIMNMTLKLQKRPADECLEKIVYNVVQQVDGETYNVVQDIGGTEFNVIHETTF